MTGIDCIRPIAHQTTNGCGHADWIYRRNFIVCGQRDELRRTADEECLAADDELTDMLPDDGCESRLELAWVSRVHYQQAHPEFARGGL